MKDGIGSTFNGGDGALAGLKADLGREALHMGLQGFGVSLPEPSTHGAFYRDWLRLGYHGGMRYLERPDAVARRLDLAGTKPSGAPIFIDYAHTPDALAKALQALRPYVANRLLVVFGCGGDRDKGKRPQMGAAAVAGSDLAIVTDDNPRSEEPAVIRREILAAAPGAIEIGDRGQAITEAVAMLKKGDVLLVAGKGHETGQTIGTTVIPFSDHGAVAAALTEEAKLG